MYRDKSDAGFSERDILLEFGAPAECAGRIMGEEYSSKEYGKGKASYGREYDKKEKKKKEPIRASSVSKIIGLILLTIIIYIPLFSAFLGLVVGFAGISIGGGAAVIGGAGGIILGIVGLFTMSFPEGLMIIGMGLAVIGVGIFLCLVFLYATKYTAIGLYKATRALIFR